MQLDQYTKVKAYFDQDTCRYLKERYHHNCENCDGTAYITRKKIVLRWVNSIPGIWLDAGCGPGPLIPDLVAKGLKVVGVDLSLEMVKFASRSIKEQEFNAVSFSVNNINFLSFSDHSFDGVLLMGVLSYIPEIRFTLKEIYRVLKPGGIGILQISNRLSLPEAEIRLLLPLWSYFKKKWSSPKGQKVHFSLNPYDQADITLRAYSPGRFDQICQSLGFEKLDSEYYDFRIPIVWKLFPKLSVKLSSFLSRTNYGRYFPFLATGYVLKVRKQNDP